MSARDPVEVVAESFCRDGADEDVCPPTKLRQCPCWREAQRLLHDVKRHAPALRAAGLLRDDARETQMREVLGALVAAMDYAHARGDTFHARVSIACAHARAALEDKR